MRRSAKLSIQTALLLSLMTGYIYLSGQNVITLDAGNLGKAWQEYVANPGSETAGKVYALLPDGVMNLEIKLQVEVREQINQGINALESQIVAGDQDSLKLAFRLFTIADPPLIDALAITLGNFMQFNTRSFLQELKNHKHLVPDLSIILCSFQRTLADDRPGQELEKRIRQKALDGNEDEDLKEIKKECLKALKKCEIK